MTEPSYFDRLYAADADPWNLASSPYEHRKIDLLLGSLPRRRYRHAFEPGCAIGVTTLALADRCEQLTAMDGAAAAVRQARERTQDHRHVVVIQGSVPADWPERSFDLIVLSELLYYLDDEARREVAKLALRSLTPEGDLVAVHWRHPFAEAVVAGDLVHSELNERLGAGGMQQVLAHVEHDFRLDVFQRSQPQRS